MWCFMFHFELISSSFWLTAEESDDISATVDSGLTESGAAGDVDDRVPTAVGVATPKG